MADFKGVGQWRIQAEKARNEALHELTGLGAITTEIETDNSLRYDELHAAAGSARGALTRVAGEGGICEQIERGTWDDRLSPRQAQDLAEVLNGMAEEVRRARAIAGGIADPGRAQRWSWPLPFNQNEQYFTGTVFPLLVAGQNFTHINRLLRLFGVPGQVNAGPDAQVQFVTTYGPVQTLDSNQDQVLSSVLLTAQAPDIILAGPDWLLVINSKLFGNPSADAIAQQMTSQQKLVANLAQRLELPAERVVHALLLRERLAASVAPHLQHPVITWETLLAAFTNVAPEYWVSVLAEALERH